MCYGFGASGPSGENFAHPELLEAGLRPELRESTDSFEAT